MYIPNKQTPLHGIPGSTYKQGGFYYGKENVYDFSLGNPNVPAPKEVNEEIINIIVMYI